MKRCVQEMRERERRTDAPTTSRVAPFCLPTIEGRGGGSLPLRFRLSLGIVVDAALEHGSLFCDWNTAISPKSAKIPFFPR